MGCSFICLVAARGSLTLPLHRFITVSVAPFLGKEISLKFRILQKRADFELETWNIEPNVQFQTDCFT